MFHRTLPKMLGFTLAFFGLGLLAQTRIIPHLTRVDSDFLTTVILENNSVDDVSYTLTPFAQTGQALPPITGTAGPQSTTSLPATELFPGDPAPSHFLIEGDGLLVTVAYRSNNAGGSPAHVKETVGRASRFRMFTGDWQSTFDGFAVVNTGTVPTDIWVAQKDFSGQTIKAVKAIEGLEPMAKGLFVIGSPNDATFEERNDGFFEVYGDQALAITALRGNIPGSTFLWTNEVEERSTATTKRDDLGIWFIEHGSLYDVIEALGYAVSTDRLWQGELFRRSARGRLAEIFGESFAGEDAFNITITYSDEELESYFEGLDSESRLVIQAYVDGFNRRIGEVNSNPEMRPFEFGNVGLEAVDPWTPSDILAVTSYILRQFDANDISIGQIDNVIVSQALVNSFPETADIMFDDLRWANDPNTPTMIPDSDPVMTASILRKNPISFDNLRSDIDMDALVAFGKDFREQRERRKELLKSIGAYAKMGSYAWAISGDKTASGNPILYSGPQMDFTAPSLIMEGSIQGGGLNVSGMTVVGFPGIILGRTPHHAWSLQVGHAHTGDLFIESPDLIAGGPHHTKTVKVRGGEDMEVEVFRTEQGPVVNPFLIISWKYAHWGHELNIAQALLSLARAQSVDEFGEAMQYVGATFHFCYADRDGNIAYWMSGRDPVRSPAGEYRLPQGIFETQTYDWDTTVIKPFTHDRNNLQGFYGGWNNKARKDYPHAPYSWPSMMGAFHRASVVQDWLAVQENLTFEVVRDFSLQVASTGSFGRGGNPWLLVADYFSDLVNANPTESRLDALDILAAWDGQQIDGGPDQWARGQDFSDGWVLMDRWLRNVIDLTFLDELPDTESFHYETLFNVLINGLEILPGNRNQYDWFTNTLSVEAPQTSDDIILKALDEALTSLGDRPWGVGMRRTIDFFIQGRFTPLWQSPGGNRSTYAQAVEMGPDGPVRIESFFALGQSGDIRNSSNGPVLDPNFLSMTDFFDNFLHRTFPLFKVF